MSTILVICGADTSDRINVESLQGLHFKSYDHFRRHMVDIGIECYNTYSIIDFVQDANDECIDLLNSWIVDIKIDNYLGE